MGNEYRIEEIYNLTLVRNNSHARKLNFKEDNHVFFMLDYFNFLHVKKLEDDKDGYKMLCGISNTEDMAAARKIMGVYALVRDGEVVKNLFQCSGQKPGETSEAPFVGIIQINIIDYEWDGQEVIKLGDIQDRLLEYRKKIEKSLKDKLKDNGEFQVFQTITSEDFCVVIRASKVCKIYEAVTGLMEIKNKSGKRVFFTYTNVGIECIEEGKAESKEISFLSLNEGVVHENADTQFVIRFRMENCVLKEIQQLMEGNGTEYKLEAVNGLFGRYDLVARIRIGEFKEIYPYLCQNKAGYTIKINDYSVFESPFVRQIVRGMEEGTIKTLNVRALTDLKEIAGQESSGVQPWLDDEKADKIEKRSEKVWKQFEDFKKSYGNRFVFNRYRYLDLCNMLERLMSSYKNLAYELDTHTNWFICNQYLEIFFENMVYYMEGVPADDERAMSKFMNEFQAFINAFGEFVRILQDNNQHTIQAPRYDVVTPIDGQKFLLAYGEYMDHMHEEYRNRKWAMPDSRFTCKEERKKARTIIYPDVSRNNIEMMEVIQYDPGEKEKREDSVSSLLLCKIPMFEYFERTYDLIPLISHEMSHSMLVLRRDIRNGFLITLLFREISKIICFYIEKEACREKRGVGYDSITELLSECLTETLEKDYKVYASEWKNFVLKHITISIYEYMRKLVRWEERDEHFGIGYILWEKIEKRFYDIAQKTYAVNSEFVNAMKEWENSKNAGEAERGRALRRIYELLLQKINDLLPEGMKRIARDELRDKNYIELDNCLADWYRENTSKCELDISKKQEAKNYIGLIRRLQGVYYDALFWENGIDRQRLDSVLEEFSGQVERRFRKEFLEGDKFNIYSSDQMQRVAYLELLKKERAKQNYKEILSEISINSINKAIEHTITFYRESCADIIMCKWLGFSSFGYFRMAVTLSERMTDYRDEIAETGLFRRRLTAVMAVLLGIEGAALKEVRKGVAGFLADNLKDKILEYIDAEVSQARERTLERIKKDFSNASVQQMERVKEIHDKFFKVLTEQIDSLKDRVREGKAPQWKGALWDDMFKEDSIFFKGEDQKLQSIFQKEINLYRRVFLVMDAFYRIQQNGQLQAEKEILEHLRQIYYGIGHPEIHPVVKDVVEFYNNPQSEILTNYEKMKGMLRFVQDHYYYNRFRKMQEEAL